MKCKGYKFSEYDATYKKATFNIIERSEGVLEVTDIESGIMFLLDLNDIGDYSDRPKGVWRDAEPKGHGVSVTFGKKGWYQKLMYDGKKRKY